MNTVKKDWHEVDLTQDEVGTAYVGMQEVRELDELATTLSRQMFCIKRFGSIEQLGNFTDSAYRWDTHQRHDRKVSRIGRRLLIPPVQAAFDISGTRMFLAKKRVERFDPATGMRYYAGWPGPTRERCREYVREIIAVALSDLTLINTDEQVGVIGIRIALDSGHSQLHSRIDPNAALASTPEQLFPGLIKHSI